MFRYRLKLTLTTTLLACSAVAPTFSGGQSIAAPAVRAAAPAPAPAQLAMSGFVLEAFPGATAARMRYEMPTSADAFVDGIGANTHFAQGGIWQSLFPGLSRALIESGIRHMRDGASTHTQYLQDRGIGLELEFPIRTTAAEVRQSVAAHHPEAVEPNNEYDSYHLKDPNWAEHIVAEQKMLYATVKSNRAWSGVKVLGPSLSNLGGVPKLGMISQYMDVGNQHDGTCNFNPGTLNHTNNIARKIAALAPEVNPHPIWVTETAFSNNAAAPGCYEPWDITAKYMLRTFALRWNYGQRRVYIYDLADLPTTGEFDKEGLLATTGAPKPSYYGLKNMISLLSDRGPAFGLKPLDYGVSGQLQNVEHTLLQKRDGSYWLLLWIEASGWDRNTFTRTPVAPQWVHVNIPSSIGSVSAYTYTNTMGLVSSTLPLYRNSFNVKLDDQITYVRLAR